MPRSPLAPISTAEQVRPAAPMSWMAITAPDAISSRQASSRQLLGEGVADLHGRALLLRCVVELGRRHGGAVDAVAAGLGAEIDDGLPDAGRRRVEDLVRPGEADRQGVDQDVAVVARVEVDLAADRRHAEGVAVAADAGDHAGDEVARLGMVGRAEAQRVSAAIGRAPMVKTSRRMPPTPVAAPW